MNTPLHSSKIVNTVSFDEETAFQFLEQWYPEMKSYSEFVEHGAKIAGYILGFLTKKIRNVGRSIFVNLPNASSQF